MKYEKKVLSSGKEIHIYDDLLPLTLREKLWVFINESLYTIGWSDGRTESSIKHKYLHSKYSANDDTVAGLLPFLQKSEVYKHFKDLIQKKSVINLSVPSDTYFGHAHPEKLVVLYYANMEWEHHWHGETLFYSEDLSEIELAIRYTPGRVIVFDGRTPHALRPQSTSAPHYRFTYAMTFD
jgi:hypothetical protein